MTILQPAEVLFDGLCILGEGFETRFKAEQVSTLALLALLALLLQRYKYGRCLLALLVQRDANARLPARLIDKTRMLTHADVC